MTALAPPRRATARTTALCAAALLTTALVAMSLLALPATGASASSRARHSAHHSTQRAAHHRAHHRTSTVWLCRPGSAPDPCTLPLTTTSISSTGSRADETSTTQTSSAYDCFYVYPTVSSEPGDNADLTVQPVERAVARLQASPFSQLCNVWAPMYRQTTAEALAHGVTRIPPHALHVAYTSLLGAWKSFLAHDDHGRPIVFIGHSQGAALLIRLLHSQVDPHASLRARTVIAILAGGNLQVPTGKTVGATFAHLALCTKTGESGCVIAYSSFPAEPPAGSPFGRPGTGVSIQSGEPHKKGQQVACVNPAGLGTGTGKLQPYFLTAVAGTLSPPVTTPWVSFPDRYTATCEHAGNVTWLQVTAAQDTSRPAVSEALGPTWGYHADDVNLALGNLLEDVAAAEGGYSHH
ncbi:MAG: DUF3089 domain-containing protein [Acidimicrobiales bacterium]